MLSTYVQITVTATYLTGKALMEGLKEQQPDVLLLDVMIPDRSGKELAPLITEAYPQVRMIALTSLDSPAVVKSMMQRGCLGYLLKDTDEHTLVTAIEHVYRGLEFIEPSLKEYMIQNMLRYRKTGQQVMPELTTREKEVLRLIVAEHTTQEIADKLFISYRTAENHRYSILQKLDVKNTAGLVKLAMQMGLLDE
jgi:two-component system secretion response regulator SsrB